MIPDIRGRFFKTDKTCVLVYEENVVDSVPYISPYPPPHTYLCMHTLVGICTLHICTFRKYLRIVIQLNFVNQWMNALEETLHYIYKDVCQDSLTYGRCSVNA